MLLSAGQIPFDSDGQSAPPSAAASQVVGNKVSESLQSFEYGSTILSSSPASGLIFPKEIDLGFNQDSNPASSGTLSPLSDAMQSSVPSPEEIPSSLTHASKTDRYFYLCVRSKIFYLKIRRSYSY